MKDKILLIIYIFILFLLYFGFQISGINTRYLATILLLVFCVIVPSSLVRLKYIKESTFCKPLRSILLYNLIVVSIPICLMTFDQTMFIGTLRLVICMVDIFLLWTLLPLQYRKYQLQFIVIIYVIQSIIICSAFISPDILMLVRSFQFDSIMEVADRYLSHGTFRGLALAGDQFYGLTASFGLVSLIIMKLYIDSLNTKWIAAFLLLFIANMFVGRTGFVGFIAAICYLVIGSKQNKLGLIFRIFVFTFALIFVLYLILPSSLKEIVDQSVFAYAFQIFYNYRDYGTFGTSSTDRVSEMWQISIGFFTLLVGDGRFTNSDGSYYGHVDVGFLRQILFGGIPFLIYSIIVTWHILTNYAKKCRIKQYMFEYVLLAYLLVVHAKGLSFMYCPEQMIIVIYYYLYLNNSILQKYR